MHTALCAVSLPVQFFLLVRHSVYASMLSGWQIATTLFQRGSPSRLPLTSHKKNMPNALLHWPRGSFHISSSISSLAVRSRMELLSASTRVIRVTPVRHPSVHTLAQSRSSSIRTEDLLKQLSIVVSLL